MTANQLVAYNLRRAREEQRVTQEEAARRFERYLGTRWSKASFSAAERSADEDGRKREFDANELLAFSQVFGKPLGWFFTPPDEPERVDVVCGEPLEISRVVGRGELLEAISPTNLIFRVQARELRRIADSIDPATSKKGGTSG